MEDDDDWLFVFVFVLVLALVAAPSDSVTWLKLLRAVTVAVVSCPLLLLAEKFDVWDDSSFGCLDPFGIRTMELLGRPPPRRPPGLLDAMLSCLEAQLPMFVYVCL